MAGTRMLIIEDDRSLSDVLVYNFQQEGFEVTRALDGQDGINQAVARRPDFVILDVMLPVIDGIEVCKRLRKAPETMNTIILMLTAKSEESDELIGFSVGADDYVCKPFSVKVLIERVNALIRRQQTGTDQQGDKIHCHGILLDRTKYKVSIDGDPLQLTLSEFRLLDTLISQPGRVFSRAELIDTALGQDTFVLERTIDVHIRSLRRKMGEHSAKIETVRGVGYRFKDSEET
ncbi:MAG: response regulator [Planctomycetota bacterium]|nr:response regulator [Planctomycetota bacterium]